MSKNLSDLSLRKGIVDNLFDRLGKGEDIDSLADEFLVGKANLYGTKSFYDFLKPENQNKKVYVCNGSACLCAGTQEEVSDVLANNFAADEIGHMTCLGRCHENGAFHLDGKNYSGLSKAKIEALLEQRSSVSTEDNYHVGGNQSLLTSVQLSVDHYVAFIEKMVKTEKDKLFDEIKTAGVRGRGGAGFPMYIKMATCRDEDSDLKFVICNADEGDPGAFSDRYLLEKQPFAVLTGMMVSAYITGASWGVLYIRAEYPESIQVIEEAISALRNRACLGYSIMGSDFNFDFKVISAQGAYICGEETALIQSIEGQRPEVRVRPPFPAQEGLFRKPTLLNNVETLAAVYHIIEDGGETFSAMGTERSNGTKLVSLDSAFNKPGIYEVEMGTPFSELIEMAGGFARKTKALQIGGPLGGIVPAAMYDVLSIDFESFSASGFLLGHASIIGIPEDMPMIDFMTHLMDFARYESCGKCFPCRLGTQRAYELLDSAKNGNKIDTALFDDLLTTLKQGSLCGHGGGIPLPMRNALTHFENELREYFTTPLS